MVPKIPIELLKFKGNEAVCLVFCKIINPKKLLGRKFDILRSILSTMNKNLTLNLQKIRDTIIIMILKLFSRIGN